MVEQPLSSRRRVLFVCGVTMLLTLPVLALNQYISHTRYNEADAWLFSYYGREIARGGILFEQLWDNKPPGIFWINALGSWVSAGSRAGTIAFCAAAALGACGLVFAMARRLYGGSAASVITIIASIYLYLDYYHVGCNRPSTFFVLAELAAFMFYCRSFGPAKSPSFSLLLAGVCAGISFWFKQTSLAVAIGVSIHVVFLALGGAMSPAMIVRRLLIFAGGWWLSIAAAITLLWATSNLAWAWHAVFAFNVELLDSQSRRLTWFGLSELRYTMTLPLVLAAATLVFPIVRWVWGVEPRPADRSPGLRPPGLLVLLWAWMIAAVVLALLGPDRRLHYWGIALPPLVMLAGHGVHLLLNAGRVQGVERPTIYQVVALLWLAFMLLTPIQSQVRAALSYRWHAQDDPKQRRVMDLAQAVRERSAPDETMFVWGYEPRIYWASDRPPAIRYIGTEKTRRDPSGSRFMAEICRLVIQAKPKVIIGRPTQWTVSPQHPHHHALVTFREWVETRYRQVDRDNLVAVWVRAE